MNNELIVFIELCGSQSEAARELKVSRQYVHEQVKNGRISARLIAKIKEATLARAART